MSKTPGLPKTIYASNAPGALATTFTIREHTLTCDETPLYGGDDEGPDPFDLIVAAVGGCTAISLRQFADRKGWEIGEIQITLTYDKTAEDTDVITKEISFGAAISEEQERTLLEVARCYTERRLSRGMTLQNTITDRAAGIA